MARLINNIADLKRHIVVSATFDFEKVLPHAKRAERKLINLIGIDQYDTFVVHTLDDSDTPINKVRELLEEAISNQGLLWAMPTLNILITNSGTKVSETTKSSNADWKEKRDLERSLNKIYNEALDDAFQIMEDNVDDFQEWRDSEYYTVFKSLIVSQTKTFDKYFTINKNRQTFIALQPYMRESEDQYLKGMLGQCTINQLKTKSAEEIIISAQEEAQKAIVALTVAKVADTGSFFLTESSMVTSSVMLPWDKIGELSEDKMIRLKSARQNAGEQYLKSLKKIIVDNPTVFTCYEDKTEKGITDKIIKKKSGLWL